MNIGGAVMDKQSIVTRREFLKLAGIAAGAVLLGSGCTTSASQTEENRTEPETGIPPGGQQATQRPGPTEPKAGQAYLAVARGPDPADITQAAIAALGGIERFVRQGDDVIVKPNICVNYHSYEYAATTNPIVVATLVALCLGAGAKRVRVMDHPFGGSPDSCYTNSGIRDAVQAVGGEMHIMTPAKFVQTDIPAGVDIQSWEVYQDVLEADVFIDVPIAKHHSLARLTLAGKNLLGVIERRSQIHRNMGERIADLVSLVRPTLTVIDAVRILMDNGPTGGDLNDVKLTDTVIASHDIVTADSYAATLFGLRGEDITYVKAAGERGLGALDLNSVQIEEIQR
jgi:uncharacterized protein (DUF362 family)